MITRIIAEIMLQEDQTTAQSNTSQNIKHNYK